MVARSAGGERPGGRTVNRPNVGHRLFFLVVVCCFVFVFLEWGRLSMNGGGGEMGGGRPDSSRSPTEQGRSRGGGGDG